METRRSVLKKAGSLGVIGTVCLAGCSSDGGSDSSGQSTPSSSTETSGSTETTGSTGTASGDITVGYVYNEPITSVGWVHVNEVARKALESEFDWYNTKVVEDISTSEAQSTFASLAEDGVDAIEAATFGYGSPAAKVVQQYDDIYIETPRMTPVKGYSGPQLGYYYGRLEEPNYAIGKAAGKVTESNTFGYVLPFAIPSTISPLNALYLGAKEVNPDVEIAVRTVNSWYDPPAERQAAEALLDEGADVLGYRTSTPVALQVAAENDVWGYGYADSFSDTDIAYDKYITSRMWNWTPFFRETARWTRKGQPGAKERFNVDQLRGNYYGIQKNGVQLDPAFGSAVPDDVAQAMEDTVAAFESGDLSSNDIFADTPYADWSPFKRISSEDVAFLDGIHA